MVKAVARNLGGLINPPKGRSLMYTLRIPWFGATGMLTLPNDWKQVNISGRAIFYNPNEGARVPLEIIFGQDAPEDLREPVYGLESTSGTAKPARRSSGLILRPGSMVVLPRAPGTCLVRPAPGAVNSVPLALPNLPNGWKAESASDGMQGIKLFVDAELVIGDEFTVLDSGGDMVRRVELPGIATTEVGATKAASWQVAGTEAQLGTINLMTPECLVPGGFMRRFSRALLHVGIKTDTEYEGLILPYIYWSNDFDGQVRAYPFGSGLPNARTSVTLDVTATMQNGYSSGVKLAMSGVGGAPIRTIDATLVLDMGTPADVNEIVPLRSQTYYSSGGALTSGGIVITSGSVLLIIHAAPSNPTDLMVARGHMHTSGYSVAMLNWISTTGSGAPTLYRADANIAAPIAPTYLTGGTGGFVFAQRGASAFAVQSSAGATAQMPRADVCVERGV